MSTPIPSTRAAKVKTAFARWLDVGEYPASERRAVLRGVDVIASELPDRSHWYEVGVPVLHFPSAGSRLAPLAHKHVHVAPLVDGLAVATIGPLWGVGWRVLPDDAYDTLSWFMHYAGQYIRRARLSGVLMGLWQVTDQVVHPFASHRQVMQRYGPVVPLPDVPTALAKGVADAGEAAPASAAAVALPTAWLEANTLDPLVHQAVFHFLRGQELVAHGFMMEAVVAFDCMSALGAKLVRDRAGGTEPTRGEAASRLGMDGEAVELAEFLYLLRNNFGAHAGGWRWWDQGEMLDGNEEAIATFAVECLEAITKFEAHHRAVDADPDDWPIWFFDHFELLWNAVWYEPLDLWHRKRARMSQSDDP